jgi:hypothetical protein
MSPQTTQICQVAGAILILVGFAGQQLGWLDDRARTYLLLNVVGAGTLAAVAFLDCDWGFLLLEGSWAAISVASLQRRLFDSATRRLGGAHGQPVRYPATHSSASGGQRL